jgi:hypothetical protein
MRIVSVIGLLLALSGCAAERTMTFVYVPNRPAGDVFPRPSEFAAEAQKECAKYGLVAQHDWENWTSFDRVRSHWRCVQPAYRSY